MRLLAGPSVHVFEHVCDSLEVGGAVAALSVVAQHAQGTGPREHVGHNDVPWLEPPDLMAIAMLNCVEILPLPTRVTTTLAHSGTAPGVLPLVALLLAAADTTLLIRTPQRDGERTRQWPRLTRTPRRQRDGQTEGSCRQHMTLGWDDWRV